jgi:uncharacterized membrane protein
MEVARMGQKAAITVHRSREEVQRLWQGSAHPRQVDDAAVTFVDAPGDRGTEIHVDLGPGGTGGRLGELARKLTAAVPLAKVKDDLRRFKQHVETGEVARSDGMPEGESLERKPRPRPAQPLDDAELRELKGAGA